MSATAPDLARLVRVASGCEAADHVLRNARVVHLATGEVQQADVALAEGRIAGIGSYRGVTEEDLRGQYVSPGFIDAHVHVESSLVPPREYARAVLPRGVTAVVTNPHEIANVLGVEGIHFMLRDAERCPLDFFVTLPSCVPATEFETSGARLDVADLRPLLEEPWVIGLGEVMDFAGVVDASDRVIEEIQACGGHPIDGHCPGCTGSRLSAYAASGITSDHESTSSDEAREKLRAGLHVFIREGSQARNLKALLPAVTPSNERWFSWCTDDRGPLDLLEEGSVDHLVRLAIREGLSPILALRMATANPASHFRLHDRGVVAPGRRADLAVFPDLQEPRATRVYKDGRLVGRDGEPCWKRDETPCKGAEGTLGSVRIAWEKLAFRIPAAGRRVRVIGIVPEQLVTECLVLEPRVVGEHLVSDTGRDLLKIAVIERHRATGKMGLGFVRGLGLREGALAGSVAHDHHNLIVAGVDDLSMETAARAVADCGGGQAVARGTQVLSRLPLPFAGLMSDLAIETVQVEQRRLRAAARELGSKLKDPFAVLSFLALEVIPELKITDQGLVDVPASRLVSLFVDE